MWVRGLKLMQSTECVWKILVAPYVGAWIETVLLLLIFSLIIVAPYVGAWIETPKNQHSKNSPCRTLCGCVD